MITALKLLKDAAAKGWYFVLDQEDADDCLMTTRSPTKAWQAVKDCDEAYVTFYDATGKRLGVAHLMAPGPNTCADDETLVNYTCKGNEFQALCDTIIEEAL